jgi:hypothetical protein
VIILHNQFKIGQPEFFIAETLPIPDCPLGGKTTFKCQMARMVRTQLGNISFEVADSYKLHGEVTRYGDKTTITVGGLTVTTLDLFALNHPHYVNGITL